MSRVFKTELSVLEAQKRLLRVGALVLKEFDAMSKDKISVGVTFVLPIILIIVAALAAFPQSEPDIIWVFDYDNSELSNRLIADFRNNTESFVVLDSHRNVITMEEAKELIPTESLSAIIIIPEGFEQQIQEKGETQINISVDGIDFMAMTATEGAIDGTLVQFQLGQGVFQSEVFFFPVLFPEQPEDILTAAAPPIMALALFASMNLIATQSIVGDLPLKRILVSPTRRVEVVFAKTIAYSSLGFFQGLIALFLVRFVFQVPFRGIFIDLFFVVFLVELTGVTIGLFFSSVSTTRLQAAQLFLLYFIMGMVVMQQLRIRFLLWMFPGEQGQVAIYNIAYRGMSIYECLPQVFFLSFNAGLFFLLTLYFYNKRRD